MIVSQCAYVCVRTCVFRQLRVYANVCVAATTLTEMSCALMPRTKTLLPNTQRIFFCSMLAAILSHKQRLIVFFTFSCMCENVLIPFTKMLID